MNILNLKVIDGSRKMGKRPSTDTYDEDWFLSRSTVNEAGCWVWNGAKSQGYGHMSRTVHRGGVHRWAYINLVGPIPGGHEIDHVLARGCRSLACCNPAHLEAVLPVVNKRRSGSPAKANGVKTHCSRGHEFTPANTRLPKRGGRVCKTCERVTHRRQARERYRSTRAMGLFTQRLLGDDETSPRATDFLAG